MILISRFKSGIKALVHRPVLLAWFICFLLLTYLGLEYLLTRYENTGLDSLLIVGFCALIPIIAKLFWTSTKD